MASILITGGTGYLGRALIPALAARGHHVRALTRAGRAHRLPAGAEAVTGDALDAGSVAAALRPGDTLVALVGTPRPSPAKARQFREVDLVSAQAAALAAERAGAASVVYVSVAMPAPVMRVYQEVRAAGEAAFRASGVPATFVRPWYVLGPGHRWPLLLLPIYALMERVPATRERGRRLGLVTLPQMVAALVAAVESPPSAGTRVMDVPAIRAARPGTPAADPGLDD